MPVRKAISSTVIKSINKTMLVILSIVIIGCDNSPPIALQFQNKTLLKALINENNDTLTFDIETENATLFQLVRNVADTITERLNEDGGPFLRFSYQRQQDLGATVMRLVINPVETKTAISLCRGERMGKNSRKVNSLVVIAAFCHNGRRVVAVKSVFPDAYRASDADLKAFMCAVIGRSLSVPNVKCVL